MLAFRVSWILPPVINNSLNAFGDKIREQPILVAKMRKDRSFGDTGFFCNGIRRNVVKEFPFCQFSGRFQNIGSRLMASLLNRLSP